jgi:hypothetical protein
MVRLLFTGLWCLADREGRLEDRPAEIKAEIFSYDDNCAIRVVPNREAVVIDLFRNHMVVRDYSHSSVLI